MTPECTDLRCKVPTCEEGKTTTISGTVYAPNGTLPLYNAMVYIPTEPLAPIPRGVTCDRCGSLVSGKPMAAAITDHTGQFVLEDVPAGQDIPLVMQVGKWRRQITVATVEACQDNLADPGDTETDPRFKYSNLTRLPRNRTEGDMPKIAVTSGQCDLMPCLLPKLGIDPAEYGGGFSPKAVNFYRGANGTAPFNPPAAQELWGNLTTLKQYDVVLHSCECDEQNQNKGPAVWQAMKEYVDLGGRLFTTDYGYTFIKNAPAPWSEVATWQEYGEDEWPPWNQPADFPINQSFPKGKALAEWLDYTNGTKTDGMVTLPEWFDNSMELDETRATRWVSSPDDVPKMFTFNSPVDAEPEGQCGRVSFGDAHIFSQMENNMGSFPNGCREHFNDREKLIAFLFFDLSACVISDLIPQPPPDVVK